ncbi:MAG: hypothetical protein IH984_02935 [Planctomycetes bacterium]|nr:hypothetical protein [Planctomycetota bacterium]
MQFKQYLFVLGTGRSGTTTCANMLSSIRGCSITHQMKPTLLREATSYVVGTMPQNEMVSLLRETRGCVQRGGERISGESNQRLAFVLPALAEAFPGAKYLWVIRDGRDAVTSMHHRYWYHPNEAQLRHQELSEWITNRIRADQVGQMSTSKWEKLDSFARCCWYWAYTNTLIAQTSKKLNLETRCVQLENLQRDWHSIAQFLELKEEDLAEVSHSNRSSSTDRGAWWKNPTPWRHWSPAQHRVFSHYCGDVMNKHYPNWGFDPRASLLASVASFAYRSAKSVCLTTADVSRPLRIRISAMSMIQAPSTVRDEVTRRA